MELALLMSLLQPGYMLEGMAVNAAAAAAAELG